MSNDLFEEITAPPSRNTRSPYTLVVSIVAHVIVITTVVIVPLLAVDALPEPAIVCSFWVTPTALPPPTPPPPRRVAPTLPVAPLDRSVAVSYEPPEGIQEEIERPGASESPSLENAVGRDDGVIGRTGTGTSIAAPAPPPEPTPPTSPVHVGGRIREPRRIVGVAPVYPSIARQSRVEGTVVIQAVIGVDGAVRDAQVQSGTPLLEQAALDAVRQWRYQPTLLNGVPVPVIMTVSVRFTLQ